MVLTAAHVVGRDRSDDDEILVWTDGTGSQKARVAWTASRDDLSLLRLSSSELLVTVPGVGWGRIPRQAATPVPAHLIGYPKSNQISGRRSKDERFAVIPPGSYIEHKLYAVDVEGPAPMRFMPGDTMWAGMSGSAVFCDGLLVGVVTFDQASNEPGRLLATPIENVQQDEEFCKLVHISDITPLATPRLSTNTTVPVETCVYAADGVTWKHSAAFKQLLEALGIAVRQVEQLNPNDLLTWTRSASPDVRQSIIVLGTHTHTGNLVGLVGKISSLTHSYPSIGVAVTFIESRIDIGVPCPVFGLGEDRKELSQWMFRSGDLAIDGGSVVVDSSPRGSASRPPKILDPYPLSTVFVGRHDERIELTSWLTAKWPPVMIMTAIGGMGKSALAWVWVMADILHLLPQAHQDLVTSAADMPVFWFSFYRPDASPALFIRELLLYMRPADDWTKMPIGEALVHVQRVLEQDDVLLVMDGLERELWSYARLDAHLLPDQHADHAPDNARLAANPIMARFLRILHSPILKAKVLITTRLVPADLEGFGGEPVTTCAVKNLSSFTRSDVINLFRAMNIRGSDSDIVAACEPYGFHPLTVSLLGGMIAHDLRSPLDITVARRRVALPHTPQRRVHILADSFAALDGPHIQLITRMSAIRIPATYTLVERLNDGLDGEQLERLLSDLISRNLVMFDRNTKTFDLHPIVRGYAYGHLVEAESIHELIAERLEDEMEGSLEALPERPTLDSLRRALPVLVELMYQLIMAEERDSAAEIWSDRLFQMLSAVGEFNIAINCIETLCRDDEALREQIDDLFERAFLRGTWAELAIQAGRLELAEEVFDIQDEDWIGDIDTTPEEIDFIRLNFLSQRIRVLCLRGRFIEAERFASSALAKISRIRTADSGVSATDELEESAAVSLKSAASDAEESVLLQLQFLEHDILLAMTSILRADNRTEELNDIRRRFLRLRQQMMDSVGELGAEHQESKMLAEEEIRLMQRAEALEGLPDSSAKEAMQKQLGIEYVHWLQALWSASENQVVFANANVSSILGLRLVQSIQSMIIAGVPLVAETGFDFDTVLERAVASARTNGSVLLELMALSAVGRHELTEGRLKVAESVLREVVMIAVKSGFTSVLPSAYCELTEVLHRLGDEQNAQSYYELAVRAATENNVVHFRSLLDETQRKLGLLGD